MGAAAPAWGRSYGHQTSDASKARLIDMASYVPKKSLFSKFKDSRGIYKLGYY